MLKAAKWVGSCVLAVSLGAAAFYHPAASAADGSAYVLEGTQVWSVPDPASGRDYSIFVSLPPSYASQPERRFPVLYVADADYGFPVIRSLTRRINHDKPVTQEFILVALSYATGEDPGKSRTRDYTPVAGKDGTGGGGAAYQAYLRDRVLPFVEAKFRADPAKRVFMGHSYGGLLGAQVLLTEPTLFKSYILGSPSFWYGNHAINRLEEAFTKSGRDMPADVFLYVGQFEAARKGDSRYNRSTDMVKDNADFVQRLKSHAYRGLKLRSIVIPDENHLTVFPAGFTRGLIAVLPAGG